MRRFAGFVTLVLCLATPGFADAPLSSLRPFARPLPAVQSAPLQAQVLALAPQETTLTAQAMALAPQLVATPGLSKSPRPRLRPVAVTAPPMVAPTQAEAPLLVSTAGRFVLLSVPRPQPRPRLTTPSAPERVETVAAVRILPGQSAVVGRKGAVCGDPDIQGEVLAPITSRVRGCGIDNPVRVTSVSGVTLNQSAIVNCQTARALKDWVATGLKPAFGRKEVAGLRIAASYSCRPRNNIKGAKISEHGRGNAIDIAAIILANGKTVSVAQDWRRSAGRPLKKAYRAACGTFGTTLGPDADRHHRDHLHFDMAAQRNGAYCR